MPNKRWVQTLVAALIIIMVGAIVAFSGETTIDVRAEAEGGKVHKVTVDVDGTVQEIELDDLADGESRTFGDGESEVTVTRDGKVLLVTTPELEGVTEGGKSFRKIFVVADDDEETKVIAIPHTKILKLAKAGDGEWREQLETALEQLEELEWTAEIDEGAWRVNVERALERAHEQREKARARAEKAREKMERLREKMGQLRERLEKLDLEQQAELNEAILEHMEKLQDLHIDIPEIDIGADWMVVPPAPPVPPAPAKMRWIAEPDDDSLVYRCEKDDVTLILPDSAAGRAINCPVCGEPMEQVEAPARAHEIMIKKKVKTSDE